MRIWLTRISSFRASHRLEICEDEEPLADVSGLASLGKEDLTPLVAVGIRISYNGWVVFLSASTAISLPPLF